MGTFIVFCVLCFVAGLMVGYAFKGSLQADFQLILAEYHSIQEDMHGLHDRLSRLTQKVEGEIKSEVVSITNSIKKWL